MSGSVVAAGVITALLGASVTVTGAAATLVSAQALHGSADAAALAAADALLGFTSGDPCSQATEIAQMNDATMVSCSVERTSVVVRVASVSLGIRLESTSRAGLSAAR
jgi:secretion/DNA translocation related TadE-like protein